MSNYDLNDANAFFRARMAYTTGVHELEVLINSDADPSTYQVVDVRFAADFPKGHVPGAINLPMSRWKNPKGLNKDATLYLYCYNPTCHLAAQAAVELTAQGYKVVEVEGGWERWELGQYAVEQEAA